MSDTRSLLRTVCDDPPKDLVDYFDRFSFGGYSDPRIGLLPLDKAVEMTRDFQSFHPLIQSLGVVILDDANTSNHHGYIARGPLAGHILYLVHDDVSRVVFDSLRGFTEALDTVLEDDSMLDVLYREDDCPFPPVIASDQAALAEAVEKLLPNQDEAALSELIVYLPTMELSDLELLDKLARHPDMYVVEALGDEIARRPRPELKPVATAVSKHKHFQAKEAGKRALRAIKEL